MLNEVIFLNPSDKVNVNLETGIHFVNHLTATFNVTETVMCVNKEFIITTWNILGNQLNHILPASVLQESVVVEVSECKVHVVQGEVTADCYHHTQVFDLGDTELLGEQFYIWLIWISKILIIEVISLHSLWSVELGLLILMKK